MNSGSSGSSPFLVPLAQTTRHIRHRIQHQKCYIDATPGATHKLDTG